MARTRSIKPGFFTNDLLGECAPLARLLFAGMWCQADRNGVVEYRPRRMKAEILPFDDGADVAALVAELEERGFVRRFKAEGSEWLVITKFSSHQTPHPREPSLNLTIPESQQADEGSDSLLLKSPGERQDEPGRAPGRALASAKTGPGERQNEPGRAPEQAGFPTASSSLLPSPLPSSVAGPADAGQPQQVRWASQMGWQGITAEDRAEWRSAFPAVDLDAELAACGVWLKAHPDRAKRSNWRKFLVGWLRNAQDRGGTRKGPGGGGGGIGPSPGKPWSDDDLRRLEEAKRRVAMAGQR